MQNYSSKFERLLQKMVSKKQFTKQEISSINGNGERKLSNVSNYIKEFSSIIKIGKKSVTYAQNGRHK